MFRPYKPEDAAQVLHLLQQNTPTFFAPEEAADLERYLAQEIEDYFVFEDNGTLLAAGGTNYFPQDKLALLSWDIVAPHAQGQGLGRQLVQHRIAHLQYPAGIEQLLVRTSQLAYRFYEKMGFSLELVKRDYWAQGFDLYQMRLFL